MTPFLSILPADGQAVIAASRTLRAQAGVTTCRSRTLRFEIAAMIGGGAQARVQVPATAPAEKGAELWRRAEELIDDHGRWARHVAYQLAAECSIAEDFSGATFWSGVIGALGDMQRRLAA